MKRRFGDIWWGTIAYAMCAVSGYYDSTHHCALFILCIMIYIGFLYMHAIIFDDDDFRLECQPLAKCMVLGLLTGLTLQLL